MDGQNLAVEEKLQHVSVYVPANGTCGPEPRALGFYGPSVAEPDGVWKWNGLYD